MLVALPLTRSPRQSLTAASTLTLTLPSTPSREGQGVNLAGKRTVIPQAMVGVLQHVRPLPALLLAASSGLHTVRTELNW